MENQITQPVTVSIGSEKYTATIQAGTHTLKADEPIEKKGSNLGPTPFQYLLSSLGACTSITLRMYADHKEWPLTGVKVDLSISKETLDGKEFHHINRQIQLQGELSAEQKERLLGVANKCPVHKALSSEFKIESQIV